ncbi:MAG: flagellar protein FlaG [Alphaproteobacteria bacterium]
MKGPQAPSPASERAQLLQRELASADRPTEGRSAAVLDNANDVDEADLHMAEQLREFVASEKFNLRTYHDEGSGRQIVEVRDQTTGDVVTQYPSEELVRLYASLRQSLVDQQA